MQYHEALPLPHEDDWRPDVIPECHPERRADSHLDCRPDCRRPAQGIVYVFLGDPALASSVEAPRVPELDKPQWIYEQDYMRDLP